MKAALKLHVAVVSTLILAQFEVGYYGLWVNFALMASIAVAAFALGWLDWEV